MGIKQTFKRLTAVRRSSSGARSDSLVSESESVGSVTRTNTGLTQSPIMAASLTDEPEEMGMEEQERTPTAYELVLQSTAALSETLQQPAPRKPVGKRKPINTARLQEAHRNHFGRPQPRRRMMQHLVQSDDKEPTAEDYLYFGEGGRWSTSPKRSPQVKAISTKSPTPSRPSSLRFENDFRPQITRSNTGDLIVRGATVLLPSNPTGKDHSGFLASGINVAHNSMGYNNLTYGGALQFDYAGVQVLGVPPGVH